MWLDKDGRVQHVGKRLKRWHAVDAGVFLFQSRIFHHLAHLLRYPEMPCAMSDLAWSLINHGDELWSCDVSDSFFFADTDNWDHFHYTPRVLSIKLSQEEFVA